MLTAEEKTKQKEMHAKVRAAMKEARDTGVWLAPPNERDWRMPARHRELLLTWGYLRGFKFRRIERQHRLQTLEDGTVFEHNLPVARMLHMVIANFDPSAKVDDVQRWIDDPSGAIPAPPPRAKKPYVAEAAE